MKTARINNQFLQTLPIFTAFSVVAFLILAFDLQESSAALLLGCVAGGLVDMDHRTSGRVKNLFGILLAFAASALTAQIVLNNDLILLIVLTVLAFSVTMFGAIDVRYRTVSFCALLVAIYTLLTYHSTLAWYVNPLMIVTGALICQFSILFFHLFFPNYPVQQCLADTFYQLSNYFQCKALFFAPDEASELTHAEYDLAVHDSGVTTAFNATRDILFNRLAERQLPQRRMRQLGDFFIAQDLHERVSASHVDYQDLLQRFEHSDLLFRIERLMNLQGQVCRQYALALSNDGTFQTPQWLSRSDTGVKEAWKYHIQHHGDDFEMSHLIDNLGRITEQLNTLGKPHQLSSEDATLQDVNSRHWREALNRLRNNLNRQSVYFRHAVRMAVISFVSVAVVQFFDLNFGYWILLTAVLVCQPNRAATQSRVVQRIVGTLGGVVLGSLLPYFEIDRLMLLMLLVFCSTFYFYFRLRNYGFSTFFITVQMFLSFEFVGVNTGSLSSMRILDTVIGTFIAWLCVRYIYPDQYYQSPRRLTRRALINNARYLGLIVEQLQHGFKDDINYRASRRRVHESASALAAMAGELKNDEASQLVQLNYRIVSHLSALALHRSLLTKQENMAEFCATADTLQMLMELILKGTIEPADSDKIIELQSEIQHLGVMDDKENIPMRSLARVKNLLAEITVICEQLTTSPNK